MLDGTFQMVLEEVIVVTKQPLEIHLNSVFFKRNTPCFFSIAWVNHQQPRSLWGLPKTCCFQMFGTDCTPGGYRESVALWNAELNRRDLNPIPSF